MIVAVRIFAAKARLEYPYASRVHPEFLALMNRLEREGDQSRRDEDYARIRMPDKDLGIFYGPHFLNLWMTAYHSGAPDRVIPIPDADSLEEFFAEADPGTHILVRKLDLEFTVPAHVTLVEDLTLYELWSVGDQGELPR